MVGMCEPMGLARSAHARNWDGGSKPTTSRGNEQPIELKTKAGILYGIVDLPAGSGPFLVVVSIAGSGPTDRDGNQPGIKNDSLKLFGQGLAAQGIAVVRYDRRGIGQSRKTAPKEEDLRLMLADDVVEWVTL